MRVLLLTVLVAVLAACQPAAPAMPARDGSWVRAEGLREIKPIVWQLRENYTVAPPRTQLLVVSWHFNTQRDNGQPDFDNEKDFAKVEAELSATLREHGTLVAVLDFNTQHDWYWYVDDAALKTRVEESLKSTPPRDIAVSVEDDAKAEFYGSLKKRMY